jgi:hypothetical protein
LQTPCLRIAFADVDNDDTTDPDAQPMVDSSAARCVAFYLPQYHPIPENDEWWGRGFTDWTNVVQGRPLFRGHYQPHLPADLGFYDLRLPEIREAQAELAQAHGINAFCYYHYWFEGKRLLHRPLDEVLASGRPDFPFCLCWANENWTRVWDGSADHVLLRQTYSDQDDLDHIRWLLGVFADKRYLRIGGRPVFLVYRPTQLPDAKSTTRIWREEAMRRGVGELYLCAVESPFPPDWQRDPHDMGFDAVVGFAPLSDLPRLKQRSLAGRGLRRALQLTRPQPHNLIYDYRDVVTSSVTSPPPRYKRFPCVNPAWDNSSRRRGRPALMFLNSSPQAYELWVRETLRRFEPFSADENLVFVNAWNEWAEGNHMEPCQRWGRAYLEAHARATGHLPSQSSGAAPLSRDLDLL